MYFEIIIREQRGGGKGYLFMSEARIFVKIAGKITSALTAAD
jgi:hypothetical protein